ncbi:hypothetical protein NA8A_12175 [Nitratireductor indicus C115]|uniref:HNH nuclease domain-containing protein n=1 Tax=Nitratireductor indicus C115 TaxID=1231190 RepID=K2P4K6_9HYPH|nr:hypothetical protein [Nitratireductor indicus]EKF42306.1 hypothetical protein NA8A_12175 [Nitratireductor indicus C115]SFQ59827.1 hypothetical protein SAMN05216176_10763 [Nitratireductor indicus]
MIGVVFQPEYVGFDDEVRKPGAAFLTSCPKPTSKQFKKYAYWSRALSQLHEAYSGVCAYTAMYLPDRGTVDHFLPKAGENGRPDLAYEWNNFRLAGGKINTSKGDLTDIIDPFHVQDDWFFIDLPACLIRPNPELDKELKRKIANTINSLRLNQDDNYVQERCNILMAYATNDVSLNFLERRYPFLAKEIARQGLTLERLRELFRI